MNDYPRRVVATIFVALTFAFFWQPLTGQGALLPNDLLDGSAPWSAEREPERPENPWLSDTIDVHAQFAAIGDDFRGGELSWWDRSLTGGLPTLKAGFSPLLLPYLLVPAAYAPGLVAALRVLVAGGALFGFLRRGLRTDRSAALVGAIAYGFTGYLVGWASWPQSNVAAFAPALLWAVEAAIADPRARRAIPVAGAIAAMYLSNFPLAATYVVIAVAIYAVGRLIGRHGLRPFSVLIRRAVPATLWSGLGVALGMAAISIYLSEFTTYVDFNDTSARDSIPADSSTGTRFLLTLVLPWAYGSAHQAPNFWADGTNWIEAQGYVGASVLLLALLAFAFRPDDAVSADRVNAVRGLWVVAVFGLWISYVGGPLTEAFQSLPLIGANSIGRSRVVSHLAIAALAGLGTQALIDHQRGLASVDLRRAVRNGMAVVLVAGLVFSPWLLEWAREARAKGVLQPAVEQAWLPLIAAAALAVVVGWSLRQRMGPAAMTIAVTGIVAIELLGFGRSVVTVVDDSEGGYETASHDVVDELLDPGERLSGTARTFWANTNQVTAHDDIRGHVFYPAGWTALFNEIQPGAFVAPGTITNPWFGDEADASHPKLDALGVGAWADAPSVPVRGERIAPVGDGPVGAIPIDDTASIDLMVPEGGLRAVSLTLDAPAGDVELSVGAGSFSGSRYVRSAAAGTTIDIAVAAESLGPGLVTIELSTSAPIIVRAREGVPLVGVVGGADDGLRLVETGAATIYERPGAAAAWFVPGVEASQVDLTIHGPSASGSQPVEITRIDGGEVEIDLDAAEFGTLVVAQYAFPGWSARIDGAPAPVVEVDALITGVEIEAGTRSVALSYRPRRLGVLSVVTALALGALVGLWLFDRRQGRPASRHTSAAA